MTESYPIADLMPGGLKILGLTLHDVGVPEVHSFIKKTIQDKRKALVLNLNINCVNLALEHAWLRDFLNSSQLTFCDGDGVRWGVRLLGQKPPPKITYDRWIWQLAELSDKNSYSFYFLGAEPGVAEAARSRMTARFPKLRILGTHHGYFQKQGPENDQVVEEINRLKPDILVMGMGMPHQEKWLLENWKQVHAHIFLSGGAVFDYVAGRAKRAPQWMIKCHLEWFYRLSQEPKRLFARYVFGNPYFIYRVFCEKWSTRKKS